MSADPEEADQLVTEFCNEAADESAEDLNEIATYYSPYFKLRFGPITPEYMAAVCMSFTYKKRPDTKLQDLFRRIGYSCVTGLAVGYVSAMYNQKCQEKAGKIITDTSLASRYRAKQGLLYASTFGIIALMHQGLEKSLSWVRDTQDDLNFIFAGLGTGLIYKSNQGLRTSVTGGAIGLAITSIWCIGESLSSKWKQKPK